MLKYRSTGAISLDRFGSWLKQRLATGDFRLSLHARQRSGERYLTEGDIMACGKTATKVIFQPDRETWKVVGKDLDDLKITVICDVRDKVIVVTMF